MWSVPLPATKEQCIMELKIASRKNTMNPKQGFFGISMNVSVVAFSRRVVSACHLPGCQIPWHKKTHACACCLQASALSLLPVRKTKEILVLTRDKWRHSETLKSEAEMDQFHESWIFCFYKVTWPCLGWELGLQYFIQWIFMWHISEWTAVQMN